MDKKAFTLTEILGIVAILGLLMLIITPGILNSISSKKEQVNKTQQEMLKEAVGMYLKDRNLDSSYCVSIEDLKNGGYLNDDYEDVTNENKPITSVDQDGKECQS